MIVFKFVKVMPILLVTSFYRAMH